MSWYNDDKSLGFLMSGPSQKNKTLHSNPSFKECLKFPSFQGPPKLIGSLIRLSINHEHSTNHGSVVGHVHPIEISVVCWRINNALLLNGMLSRSDRIYRLFLLLKDLCRSIFKFMKH